MSDGNPTLNVISYNIWFDDYMKYDRLSLLVSYLLNADVDVICLQEVTQYSFTYITKRMEGYNHYPKTFNRNYGNLILTKHEINKHKIFPLKSNMGRDLTAIMIGIDYEREIDGKIELGRHSIAITNCHFESEFKDFNMIKIEQYASVLDILNQMADEVDGVILCADTNMIQTEQAYFITKDSRWIDCWEEINNDGSLDDIVYTYDSMTNSNLKQRGITNLRSRIDRIIYRSLNCLRLESYELIKDVDEELEISDHYGIYVKFNMNMHEESITL